MTDFEQYGTFFILITDDVTCQMPAMPPPPVAEPQRTLDWAAGWYNEAWTGPNGAGPQDAFACAAGSYAAAYRLVEGSWESYFPDRPEISNMGLLDRHDAFLILAAAPVSCTMPIAP